ncbi:50S ribosomal protein L13 [Candidatus Woesearchaeota archaeon]|jgi:large subunit ribosomal protein L13|nr:50S ribosomal protein L13 [Candidatus Woesearchaeota archaeon]MBT4110837.1 50S ribosomal protein L13 [Candidatus Woesearchaeota archaeon]MBT4336651.1 50S ribosomal protein L13 [Candidatus Woesearchaeota archaeon]MBT4469600.1 50S ribosomal protein L13 [Candidatus Woesearchaeota archaeon]MBT6743962.1 50S ribosomal protein L13 [Candidatus Woesearchaeota archaeon]
MKIYNGEGMILGRMAAVIAKASLLGEEVNVVNCEKMVVSGRKTNTVAQEKQKRDRKGYPLKSAKFSKLPDRYVRRTIRGMVPWKQARGKEAYKRVMCYIGIPAGLADKEMITIKEASMKKLPTLKYMTVGEVCKRLGGKL